MVKQITLKQLQEAVKKEKAKAKTMEERRALEAELKSLRAGRGTKLLKRLGRGFVILGKKGAKATGAGIVKARKFAEESGAGQGLDVELASSLPRKGRVTTRTVRVRRGPKKTVVTRKVRTTIRRVKAKPKRNKVIRRVREDNGFFSGLSDIGI